MGKLQHPVVYGGFKYILGDIFGESVKGDIFRYFLGVLGIIEQYEFLSGIICLLLGKIIYVIIKAPFVNSTQK